MHYEFNQDAGKLSLAIISLPKLQPTVTCDRAFFPFYCRVSVADVQFCRVKMLKFDNYS